MVGPLMPLAVGQEKFLFLIFFKGREGKANCCELALIGGTSRVLFDGNRALGAHGASSL